MDEIYVIDTETTGLNGFPFDFIVEIAICKITNKKEITEVYNSVVGHNVTIWPYTLRSSWIFYNSTLTLKDVKNAKKQILVAHDIRLILKGKIVTSFNVDFDFRKFLSKAPWKLTGVISKIYPCIMLASTNLCKIPGPYDNYKWPTLYEAYKILCDGKNPISHRAMDDARMASEVLVKIFETSP